MGGDYDSDRPPRAEIPIPSVPPYTAFVGNLSFEVGQADLADFFAGLDVSSRFVFEGWKRERFKDAGMGNGAATDADR